MTDFKERIKKLEEAFGGRGKEKKIVIITAYSKEESDKKVAEAKETYGKDYDLELYIVNYLPCIKPSP